MAQVANGKYSCVHGLRVGGQSDKRFYRTVCIHACMYVCVCVYDKAFYHHAIYMHIYNI